MNRLYILLFSLIISQSTFAQLEWQEHLSHDRQAYSHLGHYVVDGEIVLLMGNVKVPMNTMETIKGNVKKSESIIREYFTYEAKSTITGDNSKEVLLIKPYDYDIPGYGTISIHENDDVFSMRDIYLDAHYDETEIEFITDAHLLGSPSFPKECISENKRYYLNEDDVITSEIELEGSFAYHEGLDGDAYQIDNGILQRLMPPLNGSIDLGDYDELYNDPYNNQLIVRKVNSLTRYSYVDLSIVQTDILLNHPIDIQFVDGGFYYLTESEENFVVYFFSDDNSDSELYYELPKTDEIAEFRIRNIEIIGEDIYFIGLWRSTHIKQFFSYVQKRTLNKDFTPNRKDIELTSMTATRDPWTSETDKYTYKMTVKNLGEDTIRHFTAYSNRFEDLGPNRYKQNDVSLILPPGESQEVEGEFFFGDWLLSTLTFHIEGVDFGIDSDESNNFFTADVVTLSNKESELKLFSLSPNLSSDFIAVKGELNEIEAVFISNIQGHKRELKNREVQNIDITNLPKGKYWLEIKTKSKLEKHPFIKI